MKIICIGDIHGRDCWIKIVEQNPDADLFLFMGDYFDSFDVEPLSQISNFNSVLKFKNDNPEKVILLIGNHDFHYTSACMGSYSGFNYSIFYNMHTDLDRLIRTGVLKICHRVDNLLFSHAGVTKTWAEKNLIDLNDLENSINDLSIYKPNSFNFTTGVRRSAYGDDINQGPLWVRERSLKEDGLKEYIHVVGHTQSKDIVFGLNYDEVNYIIIDTLGNDTYLEILFTNEGKKMFNSKKIH